MVRTYKPKTQRKISSPSKLRAAVESVLKSKWPIRRAATINGINRQTLFRAVKEAKARHQDASCLKNLTYSHRKIFSSVLEDSIASYCIEVSRMGYGLSVEMVRGLAFEVAKKNNLTMPANWVTNEKAGKDWFHGFRKRHPELSIRVPEGCSIARAMAFNRTTVEVFFSKLEEVLSRHPSFQDGSSIYNLDETSNSTVQNVRKLVSPRGEKQVHQVKGAERGVTVTTAIIIGAHGAFLPPIMIFPRKKFVSSLIINCFPGTVGLGNEKGYMTKESFVQVMQHFIKCTGASKDNPKLLLLDNVESHFSTETLDLARDNGVVVFTFPPHCTHRLQPLDVGVFGPFKTYYDGAIHAYYHKNPANPVTIYHIAGFVKEAMMKISPGTIIKSFEATGIQPLNKHIFTDKDFAMAEVTKKPAPENSESAAGKSESESAAVEEVLVSSVQENEVDDPDPMTEANENHDIPATPPLLTPRKIRGYPKAKPKEKQRKPRRKGKCMVATDSPNKKEIEEREIQQREKKALTEKRKKDREERNAAKKVKQSEVGKGKKKGSARKMLTYVSEKSDSESDVITKKVNVRTNKPKESSTKPVEGDYVLVQFLQRKKQVHYVGKVVKDCDEEGDYEVSYLRHCEGDRFKMPPIPDIASVPKSDIKCSLPKPAYPDGYTERQQSVLKFNFDFTGVKLG